MIKSQHQTNKHVMYAVANNFNSLSRDYCFNTFLLRFDSICKWQLIYIHYCCSHKTTQVKGCRYTFGRMKAGDVISRE